MNQAIDFSEEDIAKVEKLLLGDGNHFDEDEKIPIIQCMDKSMCVMACPGSGKTTALLAKITMLLDRLPLENNKGVCIITHTNVAINEIRNKLGGKSEQLFQYPNFIGTIHAFIDKFIAIPYMKQKYGGRIISIDDEYYFIRMKQQTDLIWKLGKSFYGQLKDEISKNPKNQHELKWDYIKSIKMNYQNGKIIFLKNGKTVAKDETKDRYKLLYQLFVERLFSKGILQYSDSYLLAKMYLCEHPELTDFFCARFNYVFMDEIQDNSNIQNEILNKIFDCKKSIIQKFGDLNQSIYDSDEERCQSDDDGYIRCEISKSMRYSQKIADFINPLRVEECEKKLSGLIKEKIILPHILIYDNSKIGEVKDKFIELIKKYELNVDNNVFKSCGWVGYKPKAEQLSIQSYFQNYISNKDNNVKYNGIGFATLLMKNSKNSTSISTIYRSAIEFCVKYLNLREFKIEEKNINKTNLINYFSEEISEALNDYRKKIAVLAKKVLEYDEKATMKLGDDTFNFLSQLIKIDDKENFLQLFRSLDISEISKHQIVNQYTKDGITIDIDTVHGVKGETHTATLYLETFYNKHTDIERALKYLLGKEKKKLNIDEKKSMKVAYVGMSRATDLLCIAVKKDHCSSLYDKLEKMKENGIIEMVLI